MGRIGSFSAVGIGKDGWALDSIRKVPGPKMENGNSPSEGARLIYDLASTSTRRRVPSNRLRTILRKTALIVLDDCRRSHRQRRAFDWGETGLATPRR